MGATMARMGQEARKELGQQMVARWTEAGITYHRSLQFVKDMLARMARGHGMTTKQRAWFDIAVLENPPALQNPEQVERLQKAAQVIGMERYAETLRDFAQRVGRGWTLSEKQVAFMDDLLTQADALRMTGPWVPTDEERASIVMGFTLCLRYNSYYLNGVPGLHRAICNTKKWLDAEGHPDTKGTVHLDRRDGERMMTVCKGDRMAMADFAVRCPIGSLVEDKSGRGLCLVMSEPFPLPHSNGMLFIGQPNGLVGNPAVKVMQDGKVIEILMARLVKPAKERKSRKGKNEEIA